MDSPRDTFAGAALVTGASAGIGAAFVRALASRKMDLVLVARRQDRLEVLAREVEAAHGVKALVVAQDLAHPDAAGAIRRAVDAAGVKVGLLINNAGFGYYGRFEADDAASDAAMVDLNCRAVVALTHAFLPDMLARGRGGLIFVASLASFQPTPYFAVYGATKAFDLMLAEALWGELSPRGIAVLGLCPGYTHTEFQGVANSAVGSGIGWAGPERVVETALAALGRQPSVIDGTANFLLANASRLATRAMVARAAEWASRPPDTSLPGTRSLPPVVATGGFQRAVARLLLAFVAVVAIDFGVLSLFTRQVRFWFPVWLDPGWAARADPWVVYSQSYFAGVFFIPVLAAAIAREFLAGARASVKAAYWVVAAGSLGFIGWWKGGLMVQYGKHREAVAWLLLAAFLYASLWLAETMPARLARVTRTALLAGLARGVALFFLVMAVVDPVLQVGVQRLTWSSGLVIEMGFFVPAGVALLFASRRLRAGASA